MMIIRIIFIVIFAAMTPGLLSAANQTPQEALEILEQKMTKSLDKQGQEQFKKIQVAHGTIRAVQDVQNALDRAVESCGQKNIDLGAAIKTSFQEWKNEVLPVVRQGKNRLDKMILTHQSLKPEQIRAYLKDFDQLINTQKKDVVEVSISDASACRAIAEQMKTTRVAMRRMISETLGLNVTLPSVDKKDGTTPQP